MESKFTLHFLFFVTFFFLQFSLVAQGTSASACEPGLTVNADIIPACNNGSSGQISLLINNGLPPYQVNWEDGRTEPVRKAPPGTYKVKITDALGCWETAAFTVSKSVPLQATAQVKHTSKAGKSNGEINLIVSGGTPPFRYTWVSSSQGVLHSAELGVDAIKKIPSGTFQILVFDAAGCYVEVGTEVR